MGNQAGRLSFSFGRRHGWVRFGDHGVRVISHRDHAPFFSERAGRNGRRYWHFGQWCLATLSPRQTQVRCEE